MYIHKNSSIHSLPQHSASIPGYSMVRPLGHTALIGSPLLGSNPPDLGTIQRIEHEMEQIVGSNTEAQLWGVRGSLKDRIEIRRFMESATWKGTSFRSANYQGSNKCNVFALDLGWRCGFKVPVIRYNYPQIGKRYTFPLANQLTTYAQQTLSDGRTELFGADGTTRWGWVETNRDRPDINNDINEGWFYILVGWRRSGTGHVGVIREITALDTTASGQISSITYNGWEATGEQAKHLTGREWRTIQCNVTTSCRSGAANNLQSFCAIHIICLDWQPDQSQRSVPVGSVGKCRLS